MKKHLKGNVYWVGKIDWELKKFHGEEYSTHKGSSYNSYVIQEEKTVLVDTVWLPFAKEFVDNLEAEGILDKLDAVVANHGEVDHSGALPELLRRRPGLPVYCTANAVKSLKGQYHEDWNFKVVKTGDELALGNGKKLVFVEARMLHWPDSMFSYLAGEAILFSNDAFGQHYASELFFNDLVDQAELWTECIKYYANILTPFSPLVTAKINEVVGMNLPLEMIATSHGVIWRKDPLQIVTKYAEWAKDYQEDRIAILYDSMWGGTRKLAEGIAKGIAEASPSTDVRLHNVGKSDKNDAITDVFRSRAILVGSPTIGAGILSAVAGVLEEIKGLKFKGKKAGVFGCYGWSGEGNKVLAETLKASGFELVGEGLKNQWNPDEAGYAKAVEYGKMIAKA
ncbi:MAG: anaerobic nitric oxide reductase flavorubredoxin [Spirochaetia bacterium]|jgi:flavorubredoxin|nr:anaerobic nitric oxide reductase flavorubredoxin [Spirochaetia bacterium]